MIGRTNGAVVAFACAMAFSPEPATAGGKAHEHGVAVLEASVEGAVLAIRLEAPMQSIVGFEHAPRTANQRERLEKARRELADPSRLFVPTPQAACRPREFRAESTLFGDRAPGTVARDGHSDLHYVVSLQCEKPELLTGVELRVFEAFPALREVRAQVVGRSGQSSQRLTRGHAGLRL